MPNDLPISPALSEAAPESLDLLMDRFSNDPLRATPADRARIIQSQRDQAQRFAEAEAAHKRPPRPAKTKKPEAAPLEQPANTPPIADLPWDP